MNREGIDTYSKVKNNGEILEAYSDKDGIYIPMALPVRTDRDGMLHYKPLYLKLEMKILRHIKTLLEEETEKEHGSDI